ncbi:AAA family ATPase [Micromonospora sp. R77]|uniref:AAA family ATPase n=1 Tax=Micromonospora sp. R77 TaxID=2925836 RepID=UPI001F603562|nr:AAA family ATPase [Micromonospora sp. R77]MCI4066601.1 AAA family ATPase [Micromonospora sp. R77]
MSGVRVQRYVLTGAPGAGKTTILAQLRRRGRQVVAEAATDVIADRQAAGCDEPWRRDDFLDLVVAEQARRQRAQPPGSPQVYDRSPLCTLALARHQGRAVTPALAAEVARIRRDGIYQRQVFLVQPLGFVTRTAARRIGVAEALAFGRLHEQVYREHGHELVVVPPGPVGERVDLIEEHLRRWAAPPVPGEGPDQVHFT